MESAKKYIVIKEVCGTCANYHQHYVLTESGYFMTLWYGHCRVPGPKHRQPDQTCKHWAEQKSRPKLAGNVI